MRPRVCRVVALSPPSPTRAPRAAGPPSGRPPATAAPLRRPPPASARAARGAMRALPGAPSTPRDVPADVDTRGGRRGAAAAALAPAPPSPAPRPTSYLHTQLASYLVLTVCGAAVLHDSAQVGEGGGGGAMAGAPSRPHRSIAAPPPSPLVRPVQVRDQPQVVYAIRCGRGRGRAREGRCRVRARRGADSRFPSLFPQAPCSARPTCTCARSSDAASAARPG